MSASEATLALHTPAPELLRLRSVHTLEIQVGQYHLVYLGCPVYQARLAGIAVHPLDRCVFAITTRAQKL
jgi:hypothetical protein